MFRPLNALVFFSRLAAIEKHIRTGEVFDTSCSAMPPAEFSGLRSVPYKGARKLFKFSELSGMLDSGLAASKYIRRVKLLCNSCPCAVGNFSAVFAEKGSAAGRFSVVNSAECLTEINIQKLPDFSKVISQARSSELITGINPAISPDLAISHLFPFEQTRLADSAIRTFSVWTTSATALVCRKARAPP